MSRPTAHFALLAAALASSAAAGADCTFTEYKKPPTVTPDDGVILFTQEVDRDWWKCAKKEGGKATLEVLVGDGKSMAVKKTEKVMGASFRVGAYRNLICDNKAKKVQFRLTGFGSMEPLSHTSEVVDVSDFCPRCEYKDWDTSVGVMFIKEIDLVIGVNPEWFECAKEGSTWEIRFYTGASKEELKGQVEPAYVQSLMDKPKHIRETIPYSKVCKGEKPAFWAYETVATGEMKRASSPRAIKPARCP